MILLIAFLAFFILALFIIWKALFKYWKQIVITVVAIIVASLPFIFHREISLLWCGCSSKTDYMKFENKEISYNKGVKDSAYYTTSYYSWKCFKNNKIYLQQLKTKIDLLRKSYDWSYCNKNIINGSFIFYKYSDDVKVEDGSVQYKGSRVNQFVYISFDKIAFNHIIVYPFDEIERVPIIWFSIISDSLIKVCLQYNDLNRNALQYFLDYIEKSKLMKQKETVTFELYNKKRIKDFSIRYINYGKEFDFIVY
jgi:hypothetical protein